MYSIYENEQKLTKILNATRCRGIALRRQYTIDAMAYDVARKQDEEQNFKALTGRTFQDSPKLLREVFDRAGERYPLTAKGNPSFSAAVLEGMETPIAKSINKIRKLEKKIGSFYSTFLYMADRHDVIHASFNSGGTRTGRMSSSEPNMQQLSKEDKENDKGKPYYIRGCFGPRPGNMFISIDYRQEEYRILMDYAGEFGVIDSIMQGEDVHETVARMMGVPRKQAKNCSFALLYGAGNDKLAAMVGCSVKEAKYLRELYFARLPKVKKFIWDVQYVAKNRGHIKNKFGRVLRFCKDEAYTAPNHLIQGTCGDVLKFATTSFYEDLGVYPPIVAFIHDELVLEVPDNELCSWVRMCKKNMENVYQGFTNIKLETDSEYSCKSLSVWDMNRYAEIG